MKFKLAAAAIFASAAFLAAPSVQAEWKPSGPITLTIGFGPGGSTDTMGRLIAANIEKTRGWTVVVKNKGGGGGVVMLKGLMQKKPDGQNIGMAVSTGVVLAVATRKPAPFQLNSFADRLCQEKRRCSGRIERPYRQYAAESAVQEQRCQFARRAHQGRR